MIALQAAPGRRGGAAPRRRARRRGAGSGPTLVLDRADPIAACWSRCDEVWTMTSLLGFEALLRGVRVTTTGAPFYAGWGLTDDRGRRLAAAAWPGPRWQGWCTPR
ncbi:MAG: hypothetical protein U5K36_01625 [Roseovarius sp.]|nr:hypothetical protein [Roseovarius sp.]